MRDRPAEEPRRSRVHIVTGTGWLSSLQSNEICVPLIPLSPIIVGVASGQERVQQEHSGDIKQVEELMCIQPVNMASVIFVSISILVGILIHPPTNVIFGKGMSPI